MGAKIDAQKKLFFENNKFKTELRDMYHPTNLSRIIDLRNKNAGDKLLDEKLLEERAARDMLEEITMSNIRKLYHTAKKNLHCLYCETTSPGRDHDSMKKHLKLEHSDKVLSLTADVREKLYYVNFMNDEFAIYGQVYEESPSDMASPHQRAWIDCESEKAAYVLNELSKLPHAHFLKCYTPCTVNRHSCLSTEHYKEFTPVPAHLRAPAIMQLIDLSIELDSMGILHANFGKKTLVEVNHKPKHYCLPVENMPGFKFLGDTMAQQRRQICELMDYIVGETELKNSSYQNLRKHFLASNTLVDLESLFLHPYITESNMLPFYYANCHIIQSCNRKFNHSDKLDRKFGDASGYREWTSRVQNTSIKAMLTSRKDPITGEPRLYREYPSDNHKFLWNTTRHVDDIDVQFESVEDIHAELLQSFPEYVQEIFEYNHENGLNSDFGPESNDLWIFKHAKAIVAHEDNSFSIPNLIVTCNKIIYMLAKFHFLCTDEDAKSSVEAAAEVLESFIRNFETFQEEHLKCTLANRLDDMTDKDKVLLATICLVYGALVLADLSLMAHNSSTSECIEEAAENAMNEFPLLQDSIQNSNHFKNLGAVNWPDIEDLKKIVGTNFILQYKEMARISTDIKIFCHVLEGVLLGD